MAISARLDFSARRNEIRSWTMRFIGADWSGSLFRAQVRQYRDQPGAPLISLIEVTNPEEEGLTVAGVEVVGGVPITTVTGRISKTTMDALPYSGEAGADAKFVWAVQVDGTTRIVGDFWALAGVIDTDAATPGSGSGDDYRAPAPFSEARITIFANDVLSVRIDGAEVIGPLVASAEAAAEAAQNAATPIRPNLYEPARSIYDSRDNTLSAGLGTDGSDVDLDDSWSVTGWLPVRPGGKIKFSQAQTYPGAGFGIVFYNASRQLVSAIEGNITAGQVASVPANAVFARFTIETARAPAMVVADADYSGTFAPADGQVVANSQNAASMVQSAVAQYGTNIFSLANTTPGALNADLGSLDFPENFLTATVAIPASVPLLFGPQTGLSDGYGPTFTDAAGRRIWARRKVTTDGTIIVPPPQAAFVRIPLNAATASGFTLQLWGAAPPWQASNPWAGRQAAILGDSITANYDWYGEMLAFFGMTVKTRAAFPGRIMAQALLRANGEPLTSSDFTGVSLTWLFLGTNQDAGTPIGSLSDGPAVPNFVGQTRKAIEQVMTWNPAQRFVVSSLLHRSDQPVKVQQAREVLEALAAEYALPFFDARKLAGISPFNQATMIPDGLHPDSSAGNIGYTRGLIPAARGFVQALAPVSP